VDAVLGQEELVVKSMGDLLNGHPLFAGVTIRGSGELVLIVDVPGLLEERGAKAKERRPAAGRSEAAPAAASAPAPELPAVEPVASGPLRVLFIDDSLSVRKFAQMTLQGLGVEVTLAVDGVDGMTKLREGTFDLVFTDLEMPRMHGFELIRELRFLPAYQDLPIVVVTSRSGHKHQQQARTLGATEYLTKPFTAQSLDTVLKRWGRRRAQPAPAPASEPAALSERKPS
jgi:chemosensory pili system protein ChpA (sensor histidine kinase/response regulator)